MARTVAERQADFQRRLHESGGRRIAFDLEASVITDLELIVMSLPHLKKSDLLGHVFADYVKRHKLISTST